MSSISDARKLLEKIKQLHEHGADNSFPLANRYRNQIGDICRKENNDPYIFALFEEAKKFCDEIEERER